MGNSSQHGLQVRSGIPAYAPKDISRPDVLQSSKWYEDQKATYKDNPLFDGCQLRHKALLNLLDSIELKRQSVNPLLTSAAHSQEVNSSIDKALKALDRPLRQNLEFGYSAVDEIDKQIAERTSLTEDLRSSETRTALRVMDAAERREALSKAIEDKDIAVLGSALNGSAMLSGLTAKEQQNYRDRYVLTHAKDLKQVREATAKASDTLEKANFAMIEHLEKLRVEVASEEIRASGWANAAFEAELINLNNQITPAMDLSNGAGF